MKLELSFFTQNIVLTKENWDIRVQSFHENACSYTENCTTIPGFGVRRLMAMGMVTYVDEFTGSCQIATALRRCM